MFVSAWCSVCLSSNSSLAMSTFMTLTILSPDQTLFTGEVDQVSLPTPQGEITVLKDHIPLVSLVGAGIVKVESKNGQESFEVSGGVVEINAKGEVQILLNKD